MISRFSASKSELARHCLWWAKPDSPQATETTSEAALAGRAAHKAIEAAILGQHTRDPIATEAVYWVDASGYDRGYGLMTEVAFEFGIATGAARIIDAAGRTYPRKPGHLYGTADAIFFGCGELHLVDWKTGNSAPSATENAQLLTLAVFAQSAMRAPVTRVIIAHVTPDGVNADAWDVDAVDLAAHAAWLQSIPARIADSTPTPGTWCRRDYCESYGLCPATTGQTDALVPASALARKFPLVRSASEITTPDHAAFVYEFARRAKAEIANLWAVLAEYTARHGAIELPDGQQWGPSETTRTSVDSTPEALQAITATLGAHADKALEFSTSLTAIHAASKAYALESGEKIAVVERRVMSALQAVGAVTKKSHVRHEERKKRT